MRNAGLRNPRLSAALCLVIGLAAVATVWSGIAEMNAAGQETASSAVKIGVGLVVVVLSLAMLYNFLRGVVFVNNIRNGRNEVARWTVPAHELDAFRENDKRRNELGAEYRNDYRPPGRTPPDGIDVIFAADGVLVGNTYFGLVTTGMFTFDGVQILPETPSSIEFGAVTVWLTNVSVPRANKSVAVLRLPIAGTAIEEARRVLAHFQKVQNREIIVNPGFFRGRIRFGLVAALICVLTSAAGFGLNAAKADLGIIPLVMAVSGAVAALGGVLLAFLAWMLSEQQHQPLRRSDQD